MNVGMQMEGLRTDQGPPLSIPLSFFVMGAIALASAGILLSAAGGAALSSRYMPQAMMLAHLGTIGFLGSVMLGALYQMIPVVAGAPVPAIRVAHGVFIGWVVGLGALLWGFQTGAAWAFQTATIVLGAAMVAFLAPTALALVRAPTRSETVSGMRLAVSALAVVAVIGVLLALGRSGVSTVSSWMPWLYAHLGIGTTIWIGGLIAAVSWQVIPMFYLAPEPPRWVRRLTLALMGSSALLVLVAVAISSDQRWVGWSFAPVAAAIWIIHPASTLRLVSKRRRRRPDASLTFWKLGLVCAAPTCLVAVALQFSHEPRLPLLFGWLALWGWAGAIVHGMLGRIVPFLIWFHRYAALVGRAPVPPMRRLLPDKRLRVGFWLHLATLIGGCAAIASGLDAVARLTGVLLAATGGWLAFCIGAALRRRPDQTI